MYGWGTQVSMALSAKNGKTTVPVSSATRSHFGSCCTPPHRVYRMTDPDPHGTDMMRHSST
jgi:hypothetical protein